jgi:hypothetical protein
VRRLVLSRILLAGLLAWGLWMGVGVRGALGVEEGLEVVFWIAEAGRRCLVCFLFFFSMGYVGGLLTPGLVDQVVYLMIHVVDFGM